jgi:hypothetical protein
VGRDDILGGYEDGNMAGFQEELNARGITPGDAVPWAKWVDGSADDIMAWATAGFSPEQAHRVQALANKAASLPEQWRDSGLPVETVVRCLEAGIALDEALDPDFVFGEHEESLRAERAAENKRKIKNHRRRDDDGGL